MPPNLMNFINFGGYRACGGPDERWADLGEDSMINPAPGFWPIFGPLGPTAGPGSPGKGTGLENSAVCATNQPRKPIPRPVRGYFVFLVPAAKR